MENMFLNCLSIKNINFSSFFICKQQSTLVLNMQITFKNCKNLTKVEFSFLDLSDSFDFTETFSGCVSLISINLEQYAFTKTYYMDKMFYGCTNLEEIYLPFNMPYLIHAKNIFEGCMKLKRIDLFNLRNSHSLMDISAMFKNCSSLKEIKFGSPEFQTRYLINMNEMFYGCNNLISIDFEYFNTDRLKNIERMFYDCSSLEFLNIQSFVIQQNISYKDIFTGIPLHSVNIKFDSEKLFDDLKIEIDDIVNISATTVL